MTASFDDVQQLRQEAEQIRLFLKALDDDTNKSLRKIKSIPPDFNKISAIAATKGFHFSPNSLAKTQSTDLMGRPELRVPGYGTGDIFDHILGMH